VIRFLAVVGLLVLVTGCTGTPSVAALDRSGYAGGTTLPEPYVMPDLSLVDTAGRPYNVATSPSKPVTLLFFGYTHCADVCVAVLADLARSLQGLDPADRDQIQVIFVTTDPGRDQSQQIRSYLDRFDPSFIGLTGDLTDIVALADRVGVDIQRRRKLPSGGYAVAHSAQLIGFSRSAGVVIWTEQTPIAALEHDFALLVQRSL
jgi:protein SCO1/2